MQVLIQPVQSACTRAPAPPLLSKRRFASVLQRQAHSRDGILRSGCSSATPVTDGGNADEHDIIEGSSQDLEYNLHRWSGGISTTPAGTPAATYSNSNAYDGNYHTYSIELVNGGTINLYVDGVRKFKIAQNADTVSKPLYAMFTNYIVNGTQAGVTFSQTPWTSSGTATTSGGLMDIAWFKVWRSNGSPNYTPLQSVSDLNVDYNGTGSIVLPSAASLWGDLVLTKYAQAIPDEANEPGMSTTTSYTQFPTGVTYNGSTRTISVDFSAGTGNAGAIHFVVYAYKPGATFEPLRFTINRGPNITTGSTLWPPTAHPIRMTSIQNVMSASSHPRP